MNPLSWLLAKLRRRVAPSGLTADVSALTPIPVSPPAPLTEAEREARQQQREQAVEQALVQEFTQALQQGRDLSNALPIEVQRAARLLRYNQADQEQARQQGQWAEQLRLVAEAQAMESAIRYHSWRHSLCKDFGHATGTKLSQHQIEPGMTLEHVLASLGTPTQVQDVSADNPNLYVFRYGSWATGSLIELHYGIVTQADMRAVAFPEHVYDGPIVSGS